MSAGRLIAYEIQTFRDGKWKIDAIFDDRDLALFEADRMGDSLRHAGIRVVEETFDESSRLSTSRTIFRGGNAEQANVEFRASPDADNRLRKNNSADVDFKPRPLKPAPKKKTASSAALVAILGLILFFGAAALVALYSITGKL